MIFLPLEGEPDASGLLKAIFCHKNIYVLILLDELLCLQSSCSFTASRCS